MEKGKRVKCDNIIDYPKKGDKCGYEWVTFSKMHIVNCPCCRKPVKIKRSK